ncbi:DUF4313 domain-containing protein [Hungatella hathewayi]|uniref:DUF4313 domain-containing protein n=1 Tax=Hungatella hathewayi TaxID=154046 RepID=UPI0011DD36C6|nr:DUF4313 domain-containing protein [Hungatella hathewayi]
MMTFPYEKYGRIHPIQLQVVAYLDGNLAIEMITWEDGCPEPWNTLTVNLSGQRQKNCAFIDTNNNGEDILSWIIRHGLAVPTGNMARSGFCTYPEYRFREDRLRDIDPEGYESYLKMQQVSSGSEQSAHAAV